MASGLVVKAASITWNTPVAIAGDADVSTSGTLTYAYCWSGISTTVNGVSFTGTTSTSSGGANVTLSGLGNNNTSFTGSGSASFSTAYQNMLAGADWNGSASATITFNNLTVGHAYFAQFWVGDWRNYNTSRNETIKGSASDNITPTLTYQVGGSGSGTYVIGGFTATATTRHSPSLPAVPVRVSKSTLFSSVISPLWHRQLLGTLRSPSQATAMCPPPAP